jgi:glycosyltransferase involved in cell wall biosynthesis
MHNSFKIIIPFYNAEDWIKNCVKSVKLQDYPDFHCILIDDISTDSGPSIVESEIGSDNRFTLVRNTEKKYALRNLNDAISKYSSDKDDIILTLDGDDWLARKDVLSVINDTYNDTGCYMTYGSYVEHPTNRRGKFSKKVPDHIIENKLYRRSEWMTSHLRTFKNFLWNHIDKKDLKDSSGEFYKMTCDLAYMFPMLEMSGKDAVFVDEILYVYNISNPLNDHKVNHRYQLTLEAEIRGKDTYDKL